MLNHQINGEFQVQNNKLNKCENTLNKLIRFISILIILVALGYTSLVKWFFKGSKRVLLGSLLSSWLHSILDSIQENNQRSLTHSRFDLLLQECTVQRTSTDRGPALSNQNFKINLSVLKLTKITV